MSISLTDNYSFKKNALGHPVRDTFTAANLDLIDAALYAIATSNGIVTLDMSFEANELTATKVFFPFGVEITKIRSIVMKLIAATNDGTITGANKDGDSDDGVVTVAAESALNTEDEASPSSNVAVAIGEYYKLTTAKANAGGKVLVTLEYKRTA